MKKGTVRWVFLLNSEPYGDLDLAVFPSVVDYRIGQDSGEINLSYQLDFDGQYASDHELHILYADKSNGRTAAS